MRAGPAAFAINVSRDGLWGPVSGEFYVLGLHEEDRGLLRTSDREFLTPGFRLFSASRSGAWDFEVEGALQAGSSRETAAVDDFDDLDHRAGYIHLEFVRSFEVAWAPRLELRYDFASGDGDPGDDENNRFDSLFGSRGSDFGPTGIYGAIARGNVSSPGLRIELSPHRRIEAYGAYRALFLASAKDTFPASGVRDISGASGSSAGHQIDGRLRVDVLAGNLRLEIGAVHLIQGSFLTSAPNAPNEGDSTYFYVQATITF